MRTDRPVVAVTLGDPAGIGPEVVWRALQDPEVYEVCRPLVVGHPDALTRGAAVAGGAARLRPVADPQDAAFVAGCVDCLPVDTGPLPPLGRPSAAGGRAAHAAVVRAVALWRDGSVDALATAPLHKEALRQAGVPYPGHTELLAALVGAPEVAMLLEVPRLRVVHVTGHLGLRDVPRAVTRERVLATIRLGAGFLRRHGVPAPRVAVLGLNPHAGEHGLFGGGEEEEAIAPAVAAARAEGWDAVGPLPADAAVALAARGAYDLVVAMYHDQGHVPAKLLGFEVGVNVTLGLPFVRTSPDHGTAFDLVGRGQADPRAMRAAILAAARYARGDG
jgi:4-hydroxythreonine-4-phosphate dehydrogenase